MTTIDYDEQDANDLPGVTGLPELLEQILLFALGGVAAFMLGIGLLLLDLGPAWSAQSRDDAPRSGALLINTESGSIDATRLGIDVDLTVSGPTMRARITQIFRNPTQDWVEATYMYPLPQGGAVDTLKLVIGDRVVVGDIKERQQARAIYEQARQAGQKAALTEQQRPNIFTNAVTNIGPGETVLVQIEYQEAVHQNGNEFSLRIPMVVGPRYNPAPIVQTVDLRADGGGWGTASSDPVPDRDRITQPVLDPDECPGQSNDHHRAPAGRLSAWRCHQPSSWHQHPQPRQQHADRHAGRRPGGGR